MPQFKEAKRLAEKEVAYVDIDETICFYPQVRRYDLAEPNFNNIAKINNLFDEGWTITYWTARGSSSGIDYKEFTYNQLKKWGCKFHNLICGKDKGSYNLVIDDKAKRIEEIGPHKTGFTCSTFDLLHPGHAIMLKDCKKVCDYLIVGLQTDPTIDRPTSKNKPIQTLEERKIMIESIKYVDEVRVYSTEDDLINLIKNINPDIRIIGSDWEGKQITGGELDIPLYIHNRDHDYSTTNLRKKIVKAQNYKENAPNIHKSVKIIPPVNLYGCEIGKDSFVGPFVEIQNNVKIGKNTKISSHSFICSSVEIGDNCFIAHGVMFTNDKFTEKKENWIERKTIIGNNVRIGSNATILPVKIGDNVVIGAGAVVTKDIPDNTIVKGNPAK
jgi:cytidyltransferase-like protein